MIEAVGLDTGAIGRGTDVAQTREPRLRLRSDPQFARRHQRAVRVADQGPVGPGIGQNVCLVMQAILRLKLYIETRMPSEPRIAAGS